MNIHQDLAIEQKVNLINEEFIDIGLKPFSIINRDQLFAILDRKVGFKSYILINILFRMVENNLIEVLLFNYMIE